MRLKVGNFSFRCLECTSHTPAVDRVRECTRRAAQERKGACTFSKELASLCGRLYYDIPQAEPEPEPEPEQKHEHVSYASSCFHSPLVDSWHCVGKTKAHCFGSHSEFSFDFLDFYALAASYLWPGIEMRHAETREKASESKCGQGLIVLMPLLKRSKRQDTS